MYFQKFPLIRLVMAYALGIIAQHYWGFHFQSSFFILFGMLFALLLINAYASWRLNLLFGLLTLLLFFFLGAIRLDLKLRLHENKVLLNQDLSEVLAYEALITQPPERTAKSVKLTIEAFAIITKSERRSVEGKVLLYTDTLSGASLKSGDIILVSGQPNPIVPPANPFEFDYQRYLAFQNVHFQHFQQEVLKVGHAPQAIFNEQIFKFRTWAHGVFEKYLNDDQIRAIALALVLGQKQELDEDTAAAYANSGAMHVLAVSGLHVGLIYLLFSTAFKKLPYQLRKRRWLEVLLSVGLLIGYALLTGSSPSVMRAVTMFSFMAVGRALNKGGSVYNALAASALVLLLIDPYLLMSVGFQLSYLAVLGIVYLQPKLYALLQTRYMLLDRVWAITCVSIAAQLATAPLAIFYFHQFPSYFLITNLFIIPAAFLILMSGIFLLLFSSFSMVATGIGLLLAFIIDWTNTLVNWVGALPYGQLTALYLSPLDTVLIYSLILMLVLVFTLRKVKLLYPAVAFSMVFCASQFWKAHLLLKKHELVVFNIPNAQVIQLRKGGQGYLLGGDELSLSADKMNYHVAPYRDFYGIEADQLDVPMHVFSDSRIVVFEGIKMLILAEDADLSLFPKSLAWDLVISSRPAHLSSVKAKEFVLNSKFYEGSHAKAHSIVNDGYYSKTW